SSTQASDSMLRQANDGRQELLDQQKAHTDYLKQGGTSGVSGLIGKISFFDSSMACNAKGVEVTKAVTEQPDGSVVGKMPSGDKVTVNPDGSNDVVSKDGTKIHTNQDGSSLTTKPDGSTLEKKTDGTEIYSDKTTGIKSTTMKDGTQIDEYPNGDK